MGRIEKTIFILDYITNESLRIWNTTYLQKAINHLKQIDTVDESLLKHISPLGWEHINLLGEYNFDVKNILESDELRPLNINNP
ncbi:Tn3 transposase DDE domain protein [compost metagenome]